MNAAQLLKPLLLFTLVSSSLMANEDISTYLECEKKYDICVEKCDENNNSAECYDECNFVHEECITASKENER